MNGHPNDYVKEWLGAYLDGELAEDRRAWVEEHLAGCPECQKELAELRALSTLLHADPSPAFLENDAAFTARVVRRLPRPSRPFSRRALSAGLRYAPLGFFGLWAFFQAFLWISSALLLGLDLFPRANGVWAALTSLAGAGAAGWLGGLFSLISPGLPTLDLPVFDWLGPLALINLAAIALLAMLFLAWFAGLWSCRRVQSQ